MELGCESGMRWVGVAAAENAGTGGREGGDRVGGAFSLLVFCDDWEEESWLEGRSGLKADS